MLVQEVWLEALPRILREEVLLKREIKLKETIKIHGFHFYSKAIRPSADHRDRIVAALTSPDGILEWGGMALCGGYHLDYVVKWKDAEGSECEVLICFGCHEIKLYGDDFQLYADLNQKTYDSLVDVLSEYEDQRPRSN